VRWAARHDVGIRARSGGHSYAGYSTVRGGLVVDLRRLDGVSLSGATATVGAGTHLIDMYAALARRGATVPGGSCPTVGIAGLALGGGMGLAARRFGLTCDNIRGVEIVTADGRRHLCDARHNEDLLWASRGGGGGNFGIVTRLQLHAHRVSSAVWFSCSWPWAQASAALAAWQRVAPHAPPELTSIFTLAAGNRVTALGQFFGSQAALRRILRPLSGVDGASLSTGTSSYLGLMQRWAGCLGESASACGAWKPEGFDAKSDYVSQPLSARARATAISWIEKGKGTVVMDAYGGAINRVRPHATAFVHRDDLFCCQYLSYEAGGSAWLQGFHAAMHPYVSGRAYQNYIDPQLHGWQRAYYGSNYARLREIKAARDPHGVFRFAQGIRAA
jgi:FAD/FMN-containing dehydrogenase